MIDDYARFVDTTTSKASKCTSTLNNRLDSLTGTTWHRGDESGEKQASAQAH